MSKNFIQHEKWNLEKNWMSQPANVLCNLSAANQMQVFYIEEWLKRSLWELKKSLDDGL